MPEAERMRWASSLSERVDAIDALSEACDGALEQLGAKPDLALLFASSLHQRAHGALAKLAHARLGTPALAGCSAFGVIGGGREVERREAISVVLARMPHAGVRSFHLERVPTDAAAFAQLTGVAPGNDADLTFLLFADPFSSDLENVLRAFDAAYPRAHKLGAVASGADAPGDAALFIDGSCVHDGLVGLAVQGGHRLRSVVAQGCRPIGDPMIITRSRDSVVYELNVGTPMEALQRTFRTLSPRDQELGRHSLHVGIEMRAGAHSYGQGDFLIREVSGIDPRSGAMAISGHCEDYQVVQFHLRDASTASEDLETKLIASGAREQSSALLMFSCLGRGQALYGRANHDTDLACRVLGPLPVGGLFGAGEIGPGVDHTRLHGYTAVLGIVSEPSG